jgi:hypothetical protein
LQGAAARAGGMCARGAVAGARLKAPDWDWRTFVGLRSSVACAVRQQCMAVAGAQLAAGVMRRLGACVVVCDVG